MSGFRAPVDLKRLHVYRQGTSAGPVYVAGNFSKELAADPTVDPCTEYVGAYVPEKTCATCKHWSQTGSCLKVGGADNVRLRVEFDDVHEGPDDGPCVTVWLQCGPTFGCVLHEEKEG